MITNNQEPHNVSNVKNKIIYKSTNVSLVYAIIGICSLIMIFVGLVFIFSNIKNALDWLSYKNSMSFTTRVYAENYYIEFNKWKYMTGDSYVENLVKGIWYFIIGLILSIVSFKLFKISQPCVILIGTEYIEARNNKEKIIAYYYDEIVLAAKNFFTVTITTKNDRIEVSHLLSVQNILKISNSAIAEKRNILSQNK